MRRVAISIWSVISVQKIALLRVSHQFAWFHLVFLWVGCFASSALASSVDAEQIARNDNTELWFIERPTGQSFFAIKTSFRGKVRYSPFNCDHDDERPLLEAIGFTDADIGASKTSPKKIRSTNEGLVFTCKESESLLLAWLPADSNEESIGREYYLLDLKADDSGYDYYRVGCTGLIKAAGLDLHEAVDGRIMRRKIEQEAIVLTCRNGEVPQKKVPEPQKPPEISIKGNPTLSEIPRTLFVGEFFDQKFYFDSEDVGYRIEFSNIPEHCSWLDKESQRRNGSRVTRILKGRPLEPGYCDIVIEVLVADGSSSLDRTHFLLKIEHHLTEELIWEMPENSLKPIPVSLKNPFIRSIEPIRLILSLAPEYRYSDARMEIQLQSDNCQWLELKEVDRPSFKRFKEAKLIGKLPLELDHLGTDNSALVCDVYVEGKLIERGSAAKILPLSLKLDYTSLVPLILGKEIIQKILEEDSKFSAGTKSLKIDDIDCRLKILNRLASEDREEQVIEEVEICNLLINWGSSIDFERILPSHISGSSKEHVLTRWKSYVNSVQMQ
jgi:hypothetical protein